jgi:hypothetical protein
MLKDGTVERITPISIAHYDGLSDSFHEWQREQALAYRDKDIANVLQARVWAEDEKHAIKIANERRIQMLAMGQWKGAK